MAPDDSHAVEDVIIPASRVLAVLVVPVLVVAFGMLYCFPDQSGILFAWPIQPRMSAMMLGATYLGGAYFFTRVIIGRNWHTVRLGFLPVTAFASILGLATVLHWEKFTPGHISFILWAFLYFTLPFIIPIVWYRNEQANNNFYARSTNTLPGFLRQCLGAVGITMLLVSALLLLFPERMLPTWPWALTPLTTRILSAMFVLPGWVAVSVAQDGRMDSARVVFGAQAISIGLILLALAINHGEVQWASPGAYAFIAGLLLMLGLIGWALVSERKRVQV